MSPGVSRCLFLCCSAFLFSACERDPAQSLTGVNGHHVSVLDDPSPYGVNVNLLDPPNWAASHPGHPFPTYADHRKYLSWTKSAGIKWLRMGTHWADVASSNGDLIIGNAELERTDSTIAMAQDSGFAVLMLIGTHTWANPDAGTYPGIPSLAAWSNFVSQIVSRHGGNVKYWQLYNEWNCNYQLSDANNAPVSGEAYGDLVNAAAPIIHAAGGLVVSGSLAWTGYGWYPSANSPGRCAPTVPLVNGMMNRASSNIDVVSLQSYNYAPNITADVRQLDSLLVGSWDRPIWLTEFGGWAIGPEAEHANIIRDVLFASPRYWQKAFVWHDFAWPGNTGWTLLRPIDSTQSPSPPNGNGQWIYSNPYPRLAYTSYRNAINGCDWQNSACPGWYWPPAAYTVTIGGKLSVKPGANCVWWATVNGGIAPFSYQWSTTQGGAGSGSEFTFQNNGNSFTINLRVADAINRIVFKTKAVTVSASAQICYF